jgi:hypothetical protein
VDTVNSNKAGGLQAPSWWALAAVIGLIKLVVFVLDSNPQVLLGDSMSYLATATRGWIPPDRSFLYGFLVHNVTTRARSLSSLLAVQACAGIATALFTAWIAVRFFGAQFRIAAAIALIVAIEPQQLMYERFVLTESLSTALFAVFLFVALEYIDSRRWWSLPATQIAGVLLIALRMTYLPVVAATTLIAPFLACMPLRNQARQFAIHLLISVSLFAVLHTAYRQWNGHLTELPPAYLYADGFFLVGTVAPLITAADTDIPQLAPVLSRPLVYANGENRAINRANELYMDGGLVMRIRAALKDDYQANAEAKRIAYRAIRRDPAGLVRLAIQTSLLMYSWNHMKDSMRREAGMLELEQRHLDILSLYHLDARALPFMKTLTREYYLGAWPWLLLVLHTPVALLVCAVAERSGARRLVWFLAMSACLQVGTTQLLQVEPSFRYLHPTTVLFALALGFCVSRLFARGR